MTWRRPQPQTPVNASEADELKAIVAGDQQAFARWLALAEPRLRASLRPFAAHVDVESVLQETLLRTWQLAHRVRVDGKGSSLLRVAFRMARNLAVDEARRLRAAPPVPWTELETTEDVAADVRDPPDPLLRALIEKCRDSLPSQPARALEARLRASGLRREEDLAADLGMRPNTFFQNLARARKLMVVCLERVGVSVEALSR